MKRVFYLVFALMSISVFSVFGFRALEGSNYVILYPEGYTLPATEIAFSFETVRSHVIDLTGNDPGDVLITVGDAGSYLNGMADILQRRIYILTWPEPSRFLNFDEWYPIVVSHEFTHVAHLNYITGLPGLLKDLTGLPLLNSQFRSPFGESTTLLSESTLGIGGRLNNPLVRSLACSMVKGKWMPSLARISSPPVEDFLSDAMYYFLPSQFYEYLYQRFGKEKVKEWLKEYSGYFMGFGINRSAEKVFGKSFLGLYEEWKRYLETSCHFVDPGRVLYLKENRAIVSLVEGDGKLYMVYTDFGVSTIYGWSGFILGKMEDGKVEDIVKIQRFTGRLVYDSGKLYFIALQPTGKNAGPFPVVKSVLYEFNPSDNSLKEIVRGNISSFDVENGSIVYSLYDPKTDYSEVVFEGKVMKFKGIVRELKTRDGELYMLVSDELCGSSIYIYQDGALEKFMDGRYKYSLEVVNGDIYFVAFDEDGANLYSFDGKRLYKLTKNLSVLGFVFSSEAVKVLSISQNFPAIALYELEKMGREEATIVAPHRLKLKVPKFKEVSGDLIYIRATLTPTFHIPLILPPEVGYGEEWGAGIFLAGSSPDYRIIWLLFPYMGFDFQFDFAGAVMLSADMLNLTLYRFFNLWEVSSDVRLLQGYFDPSSMYALGAFGSVSSGGWYLGAFAEMTFGVLGSNLRLGWGDEGFLGSVYSFYRGGNFILKSNLKYYGGVSGEFGLAFPAMFLDLGNFDPYFHLSHIFLEVDGGYDGELYTKVMVGFEEADIFTYSRNSPKIGIKISQGGVSLEYGLGF